MCQARISCKVCPQTVFAIVQFGMAHLGISWQASSHIGHISGESCFDFAAPAVDMSSYKIVLETEREMDAAATFPWWRLLLSIVPEVSHENPYCGLQFTLTLHSIIDVNKVCTCLQYLNHAH